MSYAYPTVVPEAESVWVLNGVDLSIKTGEFVVIMGATGEGKTTLCLALNGIVPHSTGGIIGGNIFIKGQNSKQTPVAELAQTVGLVFQEPETQLFNMTVEAEVAFGLETLGMLPEEMERRIDWALSLVSMTHFRRRSPFELSGGQKQRVAIASILAMKPPLLVLDEPTANLDPLGKREVFSAVQRLREEEDITIVMVSHEADQIATFADRVVILEQGKVAGSGSPREIFLQQEKMRQFGLGTPQVSELADRLNENGRFPTTFSFTQLNEAATALKTYPVQQPDAISEATPSAKMQFIIEGLSYSYDRQQALHDITLSISVGEFVAVLGQNGSGKTTLVKHLNGLLRPTSGRILLYGVDIATRPVAELARTIGYVFQNPDHMIFSPTVREELAAGPRNLGLDDAEVTKRVDAMLHQFNLERYADQQPAILSFGLRRKVSVAAVVAMQTAVLILDEPTSGLDQRSTNELMDILHSLNQLGHTIILITHDMRLVADHVARTILLHNGRLLAHDNTRHIFQQTNLLQQTALEPPQIMQLGQQLGISAQTVAELYNSLVEPS